MILLCTILGVRPLCASICPVCVSDASGPPARSSVCELSSRLLFLPLVSRLSRSRVQISLGIMSFPSVSICSTSLLAVPRVSHRNPCIRSSSTRHSWICCGLSIPDLHIDLAQKSWRRLWHTGFRTNLGSPSLFCFRRASLQAPESISYASSKARLSHLFTKCCLFFHPNYLQSPSPTCSRSGASSLTCLTIAVCVAVNISTSISTTSCLC